MEKQIERTGTFSSSSIWKLMTNDRKGTGFGAPALKYIKQVNYERRLGRPINKEISARATSWGNMMELFVFEKLLGINYKLVNKERLIHPELNYWTGAPDLIGENLEGDIKSPFSIEMFCDKIEALKNIETYKDEFPEDYWQHISNCILAGSKHFEAILFMPYKEELEILKDFVSNLDINQNKIAWLGFAEDGDLPYLIKGRHYKNINIFRFTASDADKQALTERVVEAGKLLEQAKPSEAKYAPTDERKLLAQEKIRLIKQLSDRLKIHIA